MRLYYLKGVEDGTFALSDMEMNTAIMKCIQFGYDCGNGAIEICKLDKNYRAGDTIVFDFRDVRWLAVVDELLCLDIIGISHYTGSKIVEQSFVPINSLPPNYITNILK